MTKPVCEIVSFKCESQSLLGVFHFPQRQSRSVGVVIVVGGPQYRVGSHRQFLQTARCLALVGYPVLRFDCRGMGDNEGIFPGFENIELDISAAIACLKEQSPNITGVVLWGLCDAASACLMYCAHKEARVAGLILANPWVRTAGGQAKTYVRHYYLQRLLQKSFWANFLSGKFEFTRSIRGLATNFMDSMGLRRRRGVAPGTNFIERMMDGLRVFDGPILLLLSERDLTAKEFTDFCSDNVSWANAIAKQSVRTEILPDTDHTFSGQNGQRLADRFCVEWLASACFDSAGAG